MGLDAEVVKDVPDEKAVSLLKDSLARCTVPIKPSTLKKLAPWTQDTASDGVAGWDALSRKYESDTFSLQEKIANSAFNGANSVPGAHDDPVLAGAFKQGGIYLEVRIVLVSLAKSMAQMKKKHGLAVVNTPKSDFSIILHVHGVRVLNGPKGPEPLIEVAFAYKDKRHTVDVASEPQVQTMQRLLQQIKRTDSFSCNIETDSTTDSARLLAAILSHNAKTIPEAHAKALMKKWGYAPMDARNLTPSFVLPMRVPSSSKARAVEKTALKCAACATALTGGAPICASCRVVHYCNRECQRAHWKVHKQTCSKPTMDVADFSGPEVACLKNTCPPGMEGMFAASVSMSAPGRDHKPMQLGSPLPDMPPSGFIVKVQIPMLPIQESAPNAAAMIYPRGKRFLMSVSRDQPDYARMRNLIRAKGFGTCKMYLWAKRVDEWTLLVHLKTYPSQEQSW